MLNFVRGYLARFRVLYNNQLDYHRARLLLFFNAALSVYILLYFLNMVVPPILVGRALPLGDLILSIMMLAVVVASHQQLLSGLLYRASSFSLGLVIFMVLAPRLDHLNGTDALLLLLPLIFAAVFLNRSGLLAVGGVMFIAVIYIAIVQNFSQTRVVVDYAGAVPDDLAVLLIGLGLTLLLLWLFGSTGERLASKDLERDERIRHLRNLRSELSKALSENAMMVTVSDTLVGDMKYAYMQVHLNDTAGRLNTYVRTGIGTRFSIRRTDLPLESIIRVANRDQRLVIATQDSLYEERSHLLPSITYGIALPLIVEATSLGVLDVQSDAVVNPFDEQEIAILEIIASDLAQWVARQREKEALEARVAEREESNTALEQQVARLRHQIDQSLGSDWLNYLDSRGQHAIGFDMLASRKALTPAIDLPEHLRPAMMRGEIVIVTQDNEQIVSVPIKQRDEVLGAMSFGLPLQTKLTDRQIEMAYQVANRLATALDNARLVEQTQAQARRERKTSEVATMLLGQQEINTLLDTAAQSFNEALGAIYTRIHVNPDVLMSGSQPEEAL